MNQNESLKADIKIHILKTDPEVFDAVARGDKTFEIRFNDRNYQVGDILMLRRTQYDGIEMKHDGRPLIYTGEEFDCVVTHRVSGPIYGLMDGWCILSFKPRTTPPQDKPAGMKTAEEWMHEIGNTLQDELEIPGLVKFPAERVSVVNKTDIESIQQDALTSRTDGKDMQKVIEECAKELYAELGVNAYSHEIIKLVLKKHLSTTQPSAA